MKHLPTLTVGIPAYNEETNIASLLMAVLNNEQKSFRLRQVIVYSDGSSDKTDEMVGKYQRRGVLLMRSPKRRGQAFAQNEIIKHTSTDYLILLNADVVVTDRHLFERLLAPFIAVPKTGLTSARVIPLEAKTFVERIIRWSHLVKTRIYEQDRESLYLCHGRIRAFSRALYRSLRFPNVIAEDAYSYLYARRRGFGFAYAHDTGVYFRAPNSLGDHLLQSRRFFRGKRELAYHFSSRELADAYVLPQKGSIRIWLTAAASRPVYAIAYAAIILISFISSHVRGSDTGALWQPSRSSKNL